MERAGFNQSLRHLVLICGYRVRRAFVDRGTALWLLALPLALMGVLGMGLQGLMSADFTPAEPFRVVLVETGAGVPAWLAQPLGSMPSHVSVITVRSAEEAQAMVAMRQADAAVLLDEEGTGAGGEGRNRVPSLTVVGAPGAVVTEMLQAILDGVLARMATAEDAAAEDEQAEPGPPAAASVAALGTGAEDGEVPPNGLPVWLETDAYTYYAVAVMAMFVMFAAHSVGATAARERTNDAYARLRALGVQPATYMFSGSMASIIVSCVFLSVMAIVARVLFGVQWGNVGTWAVLTLAGAAASAGLSLVVLSVIPKPEHVDGAGAAIFNVLAFLGGSMTPLHVLPEWFRTSLTWLPSRAVLTGYLKATQGADLAAVSGELRTLGGATAVLFALGWAIWALRAREEA